MKNRFYDFTDHEHYYIKKYKQMLRGFNKTPIETGVMIQVKEVVAGVLIVERI